MSCLGLPARRNMFISKSFTCLKLVAWTPIRPSSAAGDCKLFGQCCSKSKFSLHSLAGRAAYFLGELQAAEEELQRAIEIDPEELRAYEGLANVQMGVNNAAEGAKTYELLVRLLCRG